MIGYRNNKCSIIITVCHWIHFVVRLNLWLVLLYPRLLVSSRLSSKINSLGASWPSSRRRSRSRNPFCRKGLWTASSDKRYLASPQTSWICSNLSRYWIPPACPSSEFLLRWIASYLWFSRIFLSWFWQEVLTKGVVLCWNRLKPTLRTQDRLSYFAQCPSECSLKHTSPFQLNSFHPCKECALRSLGLWIVWPIRNQWRKRNAVSYQYRSRSYLAWHLYARNALSEWIQVFGAVLSE